MADAMRVKLLNKIFADGDGFGFFHAHLRKITTNIAV